MQALGGRGGGVAAARCTMGSSLRMTRLRARFDIARVEIGSAFVLRVSFCWCFKGEPKGTMVHKAKTPPKGRRTFREQS